MKAKIRIEYLGKTYRVGSSHRCASKRDCDLYRRGVCDNANDGVSLPCEAIHEAFVKICDGGSPGNCFKEVSK